MIPVINDIDVMLQAAPSRYGEIVDRDLRLSASAQTFEVALDATVSPAAIVFIASMLGASGTVTFSTDTGAVLAVDGNVATLSAAAMVGKACIITATMTVQGEQFVARQAVLKVLAFDPAVPPAPAGLVTAGALASIQLTWTPTNNTNIGKVEILRSLANDSASAVPIGTTAGLARTFTDNIGAAGQFYYWIRYISKANVTGPLNLPAGTQGATGTSADLLLELLEGGISEAQLLEALQDRISLIDADGTGLVDRVEALTEIYGDTAGSAASAAAAAQSAADAVAAKAAALLAAGDSASAATAADGHRLAAASSNASAGTSAAAALTSAESASTFATNAGTAAAASQQSKLDAQTASGTAQGAATAAVTARDTAVAQAGAAGTSASAASTSATTASTKAGEASTSASNAATSASNASGSANSASTSATNAAASRDTAGGSATAAAGSASAAGTSATTAGNSATAANSAKVAAESARDAAAGSASAASSSASTASTKATEAGGSATAASQSANTASTGASSALAYRDSAAQSATNAQGYASAAAQDYTAVNARLNGAGGTGVTVEQALTANASSISGFSGQVTTKIDINGYVTGYGLMSTANTAAPTSTFTVLAAAFRVVAPGASPATMFSVANGNVGFSGKLIGPDGTLGALEVLTHVRCGQTAYNTGIGFFQGLVGGVSKWSVGNSAGAHMKHDGSALSIVNATMTSPVISNPTLDAFTLGGSFIDEVIGANASAGGTAQAVSFYASPSGGKAPYKCVWAYSKTSGANLALTASAPVGTSFGVSCAAGNNTTITLGVTCTCTDDNGRSIVQTGYGTVTYGSA